MNHYWRSPFSTMGSAAGYEEHALWGVTSLYTTARSVKRQGTLFYITQRFHIFPVNQLFARQQAKLNAPNKSFFAMAIKEPDMKRLKGSTRRTFMWDGNVIFHKISGQITVQQLKVLIERITLGAKICMTYSLTCPTSFVLHKRLNESENHLQLPSRFFVV